MRTLAIARKTLLETARQPKLLALTLLMPLGFVAVFAASYSTPRQPTHALAVRLADARARPLLRAIEQRRYADGRRVFELRAMPEAARVDHELAKGTLTATVVLEASPDGLPTATVRGDATSERFLAASAELTALGGEVAEQARAGRRLTDVRVQPVDRVGPITELDAYAPGLIVFAILLLIPQTALLLGQELRQGTLARLRLTRLSSAELLGGVALAQMLVATVQVGSVLLFARLVGFHAQGGFASALLVGLVLSFSAIGLGLGVACFVHNDSQATNVGSGVAMVQVFLAGCFFPMPRFAFATLAGHEVGPFDVFPATHGFMALQELLSSGCSLADVSFRVGAAALLSLVLFAAGVLVFQRTQMRGAG